MALIICSECGKEISSNAPACPHCGCPTEAGRKAEQERAEREEQQWERAEARREAAEMRRAKARIQELGMLRASQSDHYYTVWRILNGISWVVFALFIIRVITLSEWDWWAFRYGGFTEDMRTAGLLLLTSATTGSIGKIFRNLSWDASSSSFAEHMVDHPLLKQSGNTSNRSRSPVNGCCPDCGTINHSGAAMCKKCGRELS